MGMGTTTTKRTVFDRDGNVLDPRDNAFLARVRWIRRLPSTTRDAHMGVDAVGELLGVRFAVSFREPIGGWAASAFVLDADAVSSHFSDDREEIADVPPWSGSFSTVRKMIVDRVRTYVAQQRNDVHPWREEWK